MIIIVIIIIRIRLRFCKLNSSRSIDRWLIFQSLYGRHVDAIILGCKANNNQLSQSNPRRGSTTTPLPPAPAPRGLDIWSRGQRRQCTLAGLQKVFYRMAKEKLPNFHETLYQNIAKETCVLELRRNTLPTVILSCSCLQEVLHSKHSFFLTGFLWERHGFVSGSKNSN